MDQIYAIKGRLTGKEVIEDQKAKIKEAVKKSLKEEQAHIISATCSSVDFVMRSVFGRRS